MENTMKSNVSTFFGVSVRHEPTRQVYDRKIATDASKVPGMWDDKVGWISWIVKANPKMDQDLSNYTLLKVQYDRQQDFLYS